MKSKYVILSVSIISILLFTACGNKQENNTSSEVEKVSESDSTINSVKQVDFTKEQYTLADIQTGKLEYRNLSKIIKLNGMINVEPNSIASVSAPLGGYIQSPGLMPGQSVRKGQILATLENPEFITLQQDYQESLSRYEYLEKEYQRQQELREIDVNSAKTFQQTTSEYKIIKTRVNALEQKLALAGISKSVLKSGEIVRTANIYAPIDGFIKTSNINLGKYVNPTDVLFELVNKNNLYLELNAFEKDISSIQVGQTVKYSLANENSYSRSAKVYLIGKAAGDNRIIPVYGNLNEKNPEIVPGMYVKAWVETGAEEQLVVPSEGIVQIGGQDYIILQRDRSSGTYSFNFIPVRKGIEQEKYVAINLLLDISTSEAKVVIKNAYTILSALINSEEEE